jgi:predicted pyridoxine 5'-phosphate oxidase superfamily flavin-nucleotide-binding protein
MTFKYSTSSRALQDRYDTRRLADRLADAKVHETFTTSDREFIEQLGMFFLATVDEQGQPTCSYKGGDPGFVRVIDDSTLAFPNYDGNGMYLSMGNISQTGRVGMLFVDFERQRRLRVEGVATLTTSHPLLETFVEAQFLVVVRATAIYPNCSRYVHRQGRAERSPFVPRRGSETPTPEWKKSDWAKDVLPKNDQAGQR